MDTLFCTAKINIGFTRMAGDDPDRPGVTQVKLRDFEVPAAGGFYLVEVAPDHETHFRDGEEIVTWRTCDELIDKARHYLSHPEDRRRIAEAGRARALSEHLWEHRFSALFKS
jgi:spore maturation protein CgeB